MEVPFGPQRTDIQFVEYISNYPTDIHRKYSQLTIHM